MGHEPTRLSSKVDEFRELWSRTPNPNFGQFIVLHSPLNKEELCDLIQFDMRCRWLQGDRVKTELYAEQIPENLNTDEVLLEVAHYEHLLGSEHNKGQNDNAFLARFPRIREKLQTRIEADRNVPRTATSFSNIPSEDTWDAVSNGEEELIDGLFGRYEIQAPLGRGGMGRVFLAHDTTLHRLVALKIPSNLVLKDSIAVKRFFREGQTSARLRHPNIASVYDAGVINGVHFLSMEYIEGVTLAEHAKRAGPIAPTQAIDWTISMAKAIGYAHQNGIIHRDIKPANIILQKPNNNPVLTDFGLAQFQTIHSEGNTSSDHFCGTPAYASPEQIASNCELTNASDYYSLGVVFFQLLTGQLPFAGSTVSIFRQAMTEPAPRPSEFNKSLNKDLDLISDRLLAKLPEERYASIDHLVMDLECVRDGKALKKMQPIGSPKKQRQDQPKGVRIHRRFGLGFLIAIVLLLLTIAVAKLFSVKQDDVLATGTRWLGEFSFDDKIFYPVLLTVTGRDGQQVKGVYRTEDKFEWNISGLLEKDQILFRFVETAHKGGPELLIKHGSLECELRNDTIHVRFADSSDGSSTRFVLTRIPKVNN